MTERYAPEIVIAFAAGSGTDRPTVLRTAQMLLNKHSYSSVVVRLSDALSHQSKEVAGETTQQRAWRLQDAGNDLCNSVGRPDALAFVAVKQIRAERVRVHRDNKEPGGSDDVCPHNAFLVWSLKRPAEVDTLRAIYRSRIFLIAVHTPLETRLKALAGEEADKSGHMLPQSPDFDAARKLIARDEGEAEEDHNPFGQNVAEAYPRADFFVDASTTDSIEDTLGRALDLIFPTRFISPSRAEYGMYVAHAAALKSTELSRQVGAAILNPDGDVIATGTNEVAKAHGGHFWEGDSGDDREFRSGYDSSNRYRNRMSTEIARAVAGALNLSEDQIVHDVAQALEGTRLKSLIEFARAVHAEMAAITDAARLGVAVKGCHLYVTTFPCHLCARLIIAAGIERVEYVYPYPKSMAQDLYGNEILDDKPAQTNRIPFAPYIGVAPRRYDLAFAASRARKDSKGRVLWNPDSPRLVMEDASGEWDLSTHIYREQEALDRASYWIDREEK